MRIRQTSVIESRSKVKYLVLFMLLAMLWIFVSDSIADQITVDLPTISVDVTTDAQGYAKFSGEGIQYLSQPGEPAIPYRVIKALLPPGADLSTLDVTVERSAVQSEAVSSGAQEWNIRPMPLPTVNADDVPVLNSNGEDDAVYNTSIRFPYSLVGNVSTGSIWDWQLVDIPIALFHWNPVTKGLFTLESSQAVITFDHKSIYRKRAKTSFSGAGRERVKNLVVNFNNMASEYPVGRATRSSSSDKTAYVIITTNAIKSASAQLANFVKQKENRGYNVHVMTENIWGGGTGDAAAENIRNWLIANYEVLNIEYVLLIGNPHPSTGNVPMKMLWPRNNAITNTQYKDSPSDYYYADLTGNWDLDGDGKYGEGDDDFGPGGVDRNYEVIVGRIPYYGNMNDLDSILAKIVSYQNETSQEWRKNVLLPMEPSDCGTPGYHLGEAIKNGILSPKGWEYHRIYDSTYDIPGMNYNACRGDMISPPPPINTETFSCTVNNVATAWNASDYGAVFWWTHGWYDSASGIMDISHSATLDNSHPSFIFQCSCFNSHPETSTNLSYSLLKNGAIATIGATRVSWYYPGQTDFPGNTSNSSMTYEYAKRLITNGMKNGFALHKMKQELVPRDMELWMNFTGFCLYGDPELAIIENTTTDNPPAISDIPDQTTQRDIEISVSFTVSDDLTPVVELELSVSSSNTSLVPLANITFNGSGEERTLNITPAQGQTGSCTLKIIVKDGANQPIMKSFLFSVGELAEWQWMNPLPQGNSFVDVWGSSDNNVFVVGENGTIFHFDGISWQQMESGVSIDLTGIWGANANDIFVVGVKGVILHYNGTVWTEMNNSSYGWFNDVWGTSGDNVYAVGEYGIIIHYDGTNWKEIVADVPVNPYGDPARLNSIWGTSENNIYAVGWGGTILHFDGTTWQNISYPDRNSCDEFKAIQGSSANDIYVVGSSQEDISAPWYGIILHYDGIQWSIKKKIPSFSIQDIWMNSTTNVYMIGDNKVYHYNGSQLEEKNDNGRLSAIWADLPNIYAVGAGGTILKYENSNWNSMMPIGTVTQFESVSGTSKNNVYASDVDGNVFHYDGSSWTKMENNTTYGLLSDICAISEKNVYAVSYGVFQYDGNTWKKVETGLEFSNLFSIWAYNSNEIFISGIESTIIHYNGNTWEKMNIGTSSNITFEDIWGSSPNDVYAVGYYWDSGESTIFHYDGTQWKEIKRHSPDLFKSVWGSSANDVYVVGSGSIVLHYNGTEWSEYMIDPTLYQTLEAIWGNSPDNIYVGW